MTKRILACRNQKRLVDSPAEQCRQSSNPCMNIRLLYEINLQAMIQDLRLSLPSSFIFRSSHETEIRNFPMPHDCPV
jgi:hypothetical protein